MKPPLIHLFLAFILGNVVGYFSFGFWQQIQKPSVAESASDKEANIVLGNAILNGIPIFDKTLQLADSNRIADAESVLSSYAWWQLEEAWVLNRQYNGTLSEVLNPLLTNVYPRLRRETHFLEFTNFPHAYLIEISNFVKEVDALTTTNGQ